MRHFIRGVGDSAGEKREPSEIRKAAPVADRLSDPLFNLYCTEKNRESV